MPKRKRHECCDDECAQCSRKRRRYLRFKVGDMVEANVGKYRLGKIIAIWDYGHTYRVEIQDENKTNVWADYDHDGYVREIRK